MQKWFSRPQLQFMFLRDSRLLPTFVRDKALVLIMLQFAKSYDYMVGYKLKQNLLLYPWFETSPG